MPVMRTLVVLLAALHPALAEDARNPLADPAAVREVLSGPRRVANAAWWGFHDDDATDALQAAINSGARRVIVPNLHRDWIVRPIELAGRQELYLEEGVVIAAKRGEYRDGGASLFTARDLSDLTIRGYGATLRMQKEDYMVGGVLAQLGWDRWFGMYKKAEWRMALSIRGSSDVRVYGLTLRDSGGDGIYVAGGKRNYSKNVRIKDVVCDNNYRQGISVISVDGLEVEDSAFRDTWGTPPSSGVDIEPDVVQERIRDVVFRNCTFADNYGDGIEVFLANLRKESGDVSILFDKCRVSSRRGSGIRVTKVDRNGPGGLIEFRDCAVENTEAYGIKVQDKSEAGARVRFARCELRNVANNRMYSGAWAPVWIHLFRPEVSSSMGGVDFVDCSVEDKYDRPPVVFDEPAGPSHLRDITGTIRVANPSGLHAPGPRENITLRLTERTW